ncbi:MAG: DUF2934 domain-containing protein [Acidobacteriia bacterium]|nr:DUF2934 domain-containing protein [Terriglobia bacterium]
MTTTDATAGAPSSHTGLSPQQVEQAIRRRAQELYEQRGKVAGHEVEDWLQAEAEVTAQRPRPAGRKRTVVVKVAGITYTGEYDSGLCGGYKPGALKAGQPVRVRFRDDKIFITRADGLELEARIIKQEAER